MAASEDATQRALQAVAQGTRWTYSLLWQLCPHQGALVWAEGHYNGAIKTRKTVRMGGNDDEAEEEEEEAAGSGKAARRRSTQLRELYESLTREAAAAAGGGGGGGSSGTSTGGGGAAPAARRPCASLAPEDLAETEWFYLICASYCFPPGIGLPGKAFATRGHVWLTGANQVDSKEFLRAILAKSAGIQTVACIPVVDGVLEIGTTEKVEEDIGFIQYARSIFMDQHGSRMVPTLSGHSTSSPITHTGNPQLQMKRERYTADANVQPHNPNPEGSKLCEIDDDDDQFDTECAPNLQANNECRHVPRPNFVSNEQATPNTGSSELMRVEVSARAAGYGCSSYVDEQLNMKMDCQNTTDAQTSCLQRQDGSDQWDVLYENLCGGYLDPSDEDQAIPPENAHYAETVLRVLRHNAHQQTASRVKSYLALSNTSSFSRWDTKRPVDLQSMMVSQRMLKAILLNVNSKQLFQYREAQSPEAKDGEGTSRTRRGQELSASHVLKERRRREKLNERFVVLRSLVPFVTKMDRASILGDTIEYLKQLRRRIQELESQSRQIDGGNMVMLPPATSHETRDYYTRASTRIRAVEASISCSSTGMPSAASSAVTEVQVSIIESDALLELRCPHRDGLLLRVMQAMHRDLWMEVTSVQASSADGVLLAELHAKVHEVHGRRSSIAEVKRAIHLILSSSD